MEKTLNEIKIEVITNLISDWDTSDIVRAWNDYCDDCRYGDDEIYENDEDTWEMLFNSVDEALRSCFYGDFRYNDEYARLNGYGNIVTFSYYDDINSPIDINDLAEWLAKNDGEDYGLYQDDLEEYFLDHFYEKHPDLDAEKVKSLIDDEDDEIFNDFITDDWDTIESNLIKKC